MSNYDSYRWVKQYGVWRIEKTGEDGSKEILSEGAIPSRAPYRYDEMPDYGKWLVSLENRSSKVNEISAR